MYTGLAGSEAEHVFPVILCERVGWLMTPTTNHFTAQVQSVHIHHWRLAVEQDKGRDWSEPSPGRQNSAFYGANILP